MRNYLSLVLIVLLGLSLGIRVESRNSELEIAGRIGTDLEEFLTQQGHKVARNHAITKIEGDRLQLESSLSIALENELLQTGAHEQNIINHQILGYRKRVVVTAPDGAPYLREIYTQGALQRTDNPFHVAIEGRGFFVVELPDGTRAYTRAGDFHYNDKTCAVTTSNGHSLGLEIPRRYYNVEISPTGVVAALADFSEDGKQEVLGQLRLVTFDRPWNLRQMGHGLYQDHPEAGSKHEGKPGDLSLGLGTLVQGHLEKSNVNLEHEVYELAHSQRRCELLRRCLTTLRPEVISF